MLANINSHMHLLLISALTFLTISRERLAYMKKILKRPAMLIGIAIGILITSAVNALTGFSLFGAPRKKPLPTDEAKNSELCTLAFKTLESIKENDFASLSDFVHSEHGILFSPHATIDLSTNKIFSAKEVAQFASDKNEYFWGVYSASGEPIKMNAVEYFARFVYYKDYAAAPFIGINRIIRSGNALENITDVFPNIQFVEFHVQGDKMGGTEDFDWSTLRLGFSLYDGSLWLTVIIHSEWSV